MKMISSLIPALSRMALLAACVLTLALVRTSISGEQNPAIELRLVAQIGSPLTQSVAFSSNGRPSVEGSEDSTIGLWHAATGKEIKRNALVENKLINCVVFSQDGHQIASGGVDKIVHIWDVSTGKEIKRLEGHTGTIGCIAISPAGRHIASAGGDGVRLWDITKGQQRRLGACNSFGKSLSFSPDGRYLASAYGNRFGNSNAGVTLWEVATGNKKWYAAGAIGGTFSVAYSPDGKQIAFGNSASDVNGIARIYDAGTGKEIRRLGVDMADDGQSHGYGSISQPVTSIAWSPGADWIVFGGDFYTQVWEARTGRKILEFTGVYAHSVDYSASGNNVLTSGSGGVARLWDATTGAEVRRFNPQSGAMRGAALSRDGLKLVTGTEHGKVTLWDATTGNEIWSSP